jgi:WD40 repeat protein
MMKSFRLHSVLSLSFFSVTLCLCGSTFSSAQTKVTFDQHVLPIMKDKCAGCHSVDKKRGGLVVNNYTALMAGGSSGAAVKPGDPDGSLLFKVMAHTSEPFMPPKQDKLPQATLDVIHKWIAGGAPENAGSKVVMAEKPKVDFALKGVEKGKPAVVPMPPANLPLDPVVRAPRETAVTALASNPWAPVVAVGGQKQVLLYNSDTLDLIGVLPFPEGTPSVLKFSRNGSLLLAGGGRAGKSGKVVIWSVTRGERLFAVGDESDAVLAADVSPDQSRVALGGPSKLVRVYSTKDGKLLHEIKKHTDWVTAIEFSPDGVLLATGDRNGGLFVWEAFTAREYFALRGHTAAVTDVSWRPDGNVVGACGEDGTVRLFEMENGTQVRGWGAHGGGAQGMHYAKDGRIVSTGRDRVTKLWDGNGGAQRSFEALPDVGLKTVFSHDGGRVIAADWTGHVAVWNTADGKRLGSLTANPAPPAEQLALAQKTLAEKQKAFDALTASAKASEAAFAKVNADLAAARKAVADTAAAFKAAEVKLTQTRAAVTTAQTALRNAQQEEKAKDTVSQAMAEAAAKVKAEAEKQKDNAKLLEAATRTLALSGQSAAEMLLAQKASADMAAALKAVEPGLPVAQQAFNVAQAAMQAAPKAIPGLEATFKAAEAKAAAELNQAKAAVARWQAATSVAKKNDR